MAGPSKGKIGMLPDDPTAAAKQILGNLKKDAAQAEIVAMARKHLDAALKSTGNEATWHKKKARELLTLVQLGD